MQVKLSTASCPRNNCKQMLGTKLKWMTEVLVFESRIYFPWMYFSVSRSPISFCHNLSPWSHRNLGLAGLVSSCTSGKYSTWRPPPYLHPPSFLHWVFLGYRTWRSDAAKSVSTSWGPLWPMFKVSNFCYFLLLSCGSETAGLWCVSTNEKED